MGKGQVKAKSKNLKSKGRMRAQNTVSELMTGFRAGNSCFLCGSSPALNSASHLGSERRQDGEQGFQSAGRGFEPQLCHCCAPARPWTRSHTGTRELPVLRFFMRGSGLGD